MLKNIIVISLFAMIANGAVAGNTKYELSFNGQPPQSLQITSVSVMPSEDVAAEIEVYDERDVTKMQAVLQEKMLSALQQGGLLADTGLRLELIITELKPNRPTMAQYRSKPGLSAESIALGGASVTGRLLDAEGNSVADIQFKWEENWLGQAYGSTTWYDARRAFDKLARKLVRDLADTPAS
ncbi:MAG: DUF3313 domain-containing protein [Robiginitomaculum sp.]|nr:DUF3313 domain-containing protein [Robiginitomaculum sp.]